MTFSVTPSMRLRVLVLLLAGIFAASTIAVTQAASGSTASAAKKKKKCKKGYKRNSKGKCVKKKKKGSTTLKVTGVDITLANGNRGRVQVRGLVRTNVAGRDRLTGEAAVTVGGTTERKPVLIPLGGSPSTQFSTMVVTSFADTKGGTVTVTVGGVTSQPQTIE